MEPTTKRLTHVIRVKWPTVVEGCELEHGKAGETYEYTCGHVHYPERGWESIEKCARSSKVNGPRVAVKNWFRRIGDGKVTDVYKESRHVGSRDAWRAYFGLETPDPLDLLGMVNTMKEMKEEAHRSNSGEPTVAQAVPVEEPRKAFENEPTTVVERTEPTSGTLTINVGAALDEMRTSMLSEATAVAERVVNERANALVPPTFGVSVGGEPAKQVDGRVHKDFERALQLATLRENTMLVGPAGCGKSYLCRQVADALGLPFYTVSLSAGTGESALTGYFLPIGNDGKCEYIPADFVKAYEHGGVFLVDEVDKSDPNMFTKVNEPLANGHMSIEKRVNDTVVERHPDFVCFASANTFGRGRDRIYVGSNALDGSTLDRFQAGLIEMDYDRDLEKALIADKEWLAQAWAIRNSVSEMKLRRIVSTRVLMGIHKQMVAFGYDMAWAVKQLTLGWSDEERSRVGA